jgi:hypothetical protein
MNTPKAGSVGLRLNTTSVNNVVGSLTGLLLNMATSGKTFNTSIDQKGWTYEFSLGHVTVDKIMGPSYKSFAQVPGTKRVDIRLSGLDVNLTTDAELKALRFIPVNIDGVNLKNLTIDFQLESNSTDGVEFHLVDSSVVTLDDFELKFRSGVVNTVAGWAHSLIKKTINGQLS